MEPMGVPGAVGYTTKLLGDLFLYFTEQYPKLSREEKIKKAGEYARAALDIGDYKLANKWIAELDRMSEETGP